jgi:hypothetical protein
MRTMLELAMVSIAFWLLGAACAMNVVDHPRAILGPVLVGLLIGIPALVLGGLSGFGWLNDL